MVARRLIAVFLFLLLAAPAGAQDAAERLQSPAAFLGYELGSRFTPHHRVMDYVRHVAAASPNVQLERYGTSYEGRPLTVAYVTSPGNLERLDAIRTSNLRRTGMLDGEPEGPAPAIVWLSYNVHGNEAVSTEAAMQVLYDLADPENGRTQAWLDDVVVLLDPCVNPDGRTRYVQWYRQTRGRTPNPAPEAREHDEPWPGGRMNHYYFDLNRDWAWATQQETQYRLPLYNRWMPHVHVDFHEQSVDAPYYFAPAAEPFHENITDFQRQFQTTIGQRNARYFDEEGWLYFTREVFDLLYPGYGDTWPLFNGAIGMTYEQGGSGRAGLAIETASGDTLTLAERIAHHHTTSLATVETTAENSARVVEEFAQYYAAEPPGLYEAFVVKREGQADAVTALAEHLDLQGIRYGYAAEEQAASGFRYADGTTGEVTVAPGDLVISTAQPKARLVKVLFEPRTEVADSLTYDITAWALPYAYGVEAYALPDGLAPTAQAPPAQEASPEQEASPAATSSPQPYAYLAEWKSVDDLRLLSALLQQDVRVRFALEPFETDGRSYERGTLVLTRIDNEPLGARFDAVVRAMADSLGQPVWPAETGLVPAGPDFGSSSVAFLEAPRVAILAGEPLSPYVTGEVWHFFDRQIRYPSTLMRPEGFDVSSLQDFDVLVLPSGAYDEVFPDEELAALRSWVRAGGRLIALGEAVAFLAGQEGFAIEEKDAGEDSTAADSLEALLRPYAQRERMALTESVPGAIFRARLDDTHPLGFGYPEHYFTLKRGGDAFAFLDDGWNVAVLREDAHVSGFAGAEAREKLENTLVFGVQNMGQGAVVYLVDNPLFRGFWQGGKLLFGNAVFLVGQA